MAVTFTTFFGINVRSAGPDAYPGTPAWAVVLLWIILPLLICGFIWKVHRERMRRTKSGDDGGASIAAADSGVSDSANCYHDSAYQEGGDSGHFDCGLHEQPA